MNHFVGCVIFDCDGTLVDSELLCNLALELKLRQLGIYESAEEMTQRYRGAKLANILDDIQNRHHFKFSSDFTVEYRHLVAELFERNLKPVSGVITALDKLVTLHIPICIASSGPILKIKHALRVTGLSQYFGDRIFSSYVVQSWKPDPDLFLFAAKSLGVSPKECIVIDDSELGIEAAEHAGMRVLWYNPSGRIYSAPGSHNITVFNDMALLPDLIKTLGKLSIPSVKTNRERRK